MSYKPVNIVIKQRRVVKSELIDRIANEFGADKGDVKKVIDSFLKHINDEVLKNKHKVVLHGFGSFEPKEYDLRKITSPIYSGYAEPRTIIKFKNSTIIKTKK